MAEKKYKPRKTAGDYGLKPIMLYIKEEEYEALRKYCYEKRLKQSPVIREALMALLRKESYLPEAAKV